MKHTMIRKVILKSNRRLAFRAVFYTSMFTVLFSAYFLLTSFGAKEQAEGKQEEYKQIIDSLTAVIELQEDLFWETASKYVPIIRPVPEDQSRVTSDWGYRLHPVYKVRKFHKGIDFAAMIGTPVYVTADGTVEKVKSTKWGYGNRVEVSHRYGYETLYAHLDAFNVKKGQSVQRGDIIGYVGKTGTVTGPHLHYGIKLYGKWLDPKDYCLWTGNNLLIALF